ncbi:MAG: PilZ domain-containing protein [Deltaproteobacteria bacterium]|nr:PilZ domain-containing protein [Deltaproteobacteria bacterium]
MSDEGGDNRRRYRRLSAPVYCRPAGLGIRERIAAVMAGGDARRVVQNISTGGVRIYTDDRYKVGDRLELEVLLPDKTWIVVEAQVVWLSAIASGEPAKFDVGLEFSKIAAADAEKLAALIED